MNILGISGGFGHDATACLYVDGKLIAYAEEERFTRIKRAFRETPFHAALYCLNKAGITVDDVDAVALSWLPEKIDFYGVFNDFKRAVKLLSNKRTPKCIPVEHHICHAMAGYNMSGFDEACVLVIDGQGEEQSTTVYHAKSNVLKKLQEYKISQSLGFFYSSVNDYFHLGVGGEGKLMGLASYGVPEYEFPINLTDDGYEVELEIPKRIPLQYQDNEVYNYWGNYLTKTFGPAQNPIFSIDPYTGNLKRKMEYTQREKNIAASAQAALENTVLHLVKKTIEQTGCHNIVVSGGVALNCTLNGKIEKMETVDRFFVMPAAGDNGTCIGAALYVSENVFNENAEKGLSTPYWGPVYNNDAIQTVLSRFGIKAQYYDCIAEKAAENIIKGNVVGWFQGAGEMGPRALGNRSVVANPTMRSAYDKVNNQVKFREPWRPLAPSILSDKRGWLMDESKDSPYMLKAYKVKEEVKDKVPAIVHIDDSTRPQTVERDANPLWYSLIETFYKQTGVPLIMNTSLNVKGEPICGSPGDAIKCLYSSAMDVLVIGNFLITKA